MRLLLDENLPKRLKLDLQEHEIYTVRDMGWNGFKNGELIQLLINDSFDALLTFDKNLQHQQNFQKYKISVFLMSAKINSYVEMATLIPKVKDYLSRTNLPIGVILISKD